MILAAGEGRRMMPLTRDLPKPLLQVHGKTLIDHLIDALRDAGFIEVVINVCYQADKIKKHLGNGSRHGIQIAYSEEGELLETAGGIQKALPMLGDQPFAVVSGDIFTDYDLRRLRDYDLHCGAHLVMVDNPAHHPDGDFAIDAAGRLRHEGDKLTWASLGVFSPDFFRKMAPGKCALRELFDVAVRRGEITAEYHGGFYADVGTPERLRILRATEFR